MRDGHMLPNGPMFWNGYRIYVTPDRPKMQLSEDCPVTPDFRAEVNAWMVQFFGVENTLADGQSIVSEINRTIFMNPRTYQHLLRAMRKEPR